MTIPLMGGDIQAVSDFTLRGGCDGCELISNMMLQISPVLGSLGMPLCLLGCVGAVMQAVQAVPDSLGPPPDPTALIQAVNNMLDKCKCVLESALPPPAGTVCQFLKMIRDIVVLCGMAFECVIGLLTHLTGMNVKAALLMANETPEIAEAGECLSSQVQGMTDNLTVKMGSLQALFVIVQPVIDLLAAVIPPPFSSVMDDIKNGFLAFTGSTPSGTLPGDVLAALTILNDVFQVAIDAFVAIVSVCP